MINAHFKTGLDRFWNRLAVPLVRAGIGPNTVTVVGLGLIALNSALYLVHEDTLLFGLLLSVLALSDFLDGAVARVSGTVSRRGAYLDAMVDRYQEIVILFAIAAVRDHWVLASAVITGSLVTSYAKARAGMEMPLGNVHWPDLFERLERFLILCAGLVVDGLLAGRVVLGQSICFWTLALLALATHATGVQRTLRGLKLLEAAPAPGRTP
jgi:phosphatidylglycerophosphate synthase